MSHTALAQEISGNFAGGSVKVGNDTATCDAARYGAIRYNTNTFWGCSTGGWVNIGTFGGGGGITALTGEVTASGSGSVAATIANSVVTNAKMANMAAATIKGNNTGAAAAPVDVTVAQLRTMLGATGTPGATTFLRGDGQWIAPPSGADDLGNHTATQTLVLGTNWVNGDAGAEGLSVGTTGQVRIDYGSATYDTWIQGGSGTSGTTRRLALLGTEAGMLYLNYASEYASGVTIGGPITITAGSLTDNSILAADIAAD
ncbi:MAG TPA: hypothetical protein PLO23_10470, partial [Alphaproteobacteria bacterium]|nr:hypothetical protein [Alphaproteobacteria bacterium]